ncbi:MAG: anthranilate phosphoribosyltransferase [Bacteroidetes bacterium]|jgi:anthranilate phosphoribosyltransferase|nr:anthranilate phosphoribosyltransferase [Bacteroidota bacterium]
MTDVMRKTLKTLTEGDMPSAETIRAAFHLIMNGQVSQIQTAAFLTALKIRGERVEDIAAAASVMRETALTIEAPEGAMDIVGTGGDGIGTYNISTAAAFVLAGAGVPVAKHGNKAVSSKSGAADVLTSLGINLDCDFTDISRALDDAGICFLMAPRHHSAMRHVAPVRVDLGFRTIFNMLGPLANPALVKRIMVGVFDADLCVPFAKALSALGTTHAWVVHGADGLDEVSTTGPTHVAALANGKIQEFTISPPDIGLETVSIDELKGGTPEENAASLRAVLTGAVGPYRDIVIFNAAAAMVAGGHAKNLELGAGRAAASIENGKAMTALEKLVAITNGKAT